MGELTPAARATIRAELDDARARCLSDARACDDSAAFHRRRSGGASPADARLHVELAELGAARARALRVRADAIAAALDELDP